MCGSQAGVLADSLVGHPFKRNPTGGPVHTGDLCNRLDSNKHHRRNGSALWGLLGSLPLARTCHGLRNLSRTPMTCRRPCYAAEGGVLVAMGWLPKIKGHITHSLMILVQRPQNKTPLAFYKQCTQIGRSNTILKPLYIPPSTISPLRCHAWMPS